MILVINHSCDKLQECGLGPQPTRLIIDDVMLCTHQPKGCGVKVGVKEKSIMLT